MHVGIVTQVSHSLVTALTKAMSQVDMHAVTIDPHSVRVRIRSDETTLFAGKSLVAPDIAVNTLKTQDGWEIVDTLELIGVPVLNSPWACRRALLKPLMAVYLRRAGIASPATVYGFHRSPADTESAGKTLDVSPEDVVLEGAQATPRFTGALRRTPWENIRSDKKRRRGAYVLQTQCDGDKIRLFAVGSEVIHDPEFDAPDREVDTTAIHVLSALGLDFAAIEFCVTDAGYVAQAVDPWPHPGNPETSERIARSLVDLIQTKKRGV